MLDMRFDPNTPKPKLFIVCGGHNEFRYWSRRINTKTTMYDIRHAHEARVIHGHRNERYICLGTWMYHPDRFLGELIEHMRASEFSEMGYSDLFEFESEEDEREYYEKVGTPKKPGEFEDFLTMEEMEI